MKKVTKFLKDIKSEIKNIKWPTKKEMIKYSTATLLFIITFTLFFGLADLLLTGMKAWLG